MTLRSMLDVITAAHMGCMVRYETEARYQDVRCIVRRHHITRGQVTGGARVTSDWAGAKNVRLGCLFMDVLTTIHINVFNTVSLAG